MNTDSITTINWHDIGDGGVRAMHDQGNFTDAIVTTAEVHQGGNGLWTPSIFQFAKGRPKIRRSGRIAGKSVSHYYPGQVDTREKAIALCERKWSEMFSQHPENYKAPEI